MIYVLSFFSSIAYLQSMTKNNLIMCIYMSMIRLSEQHEILNMRPRCFNSALNRKSWTPQGYLGTFTAFTNEDLLKYWTLYPWLDYRWSSLCSLIIFPSLALNSLKRPEYTHVRKNARMPSDKLWATDEQRKSRLSGAPTLCALVFGGAIRVW